MKGKHCTVNPDPSRAGIQHRIPKRLFLNSMLGVECSMFDVNNNPNLHRLCHLAAINFPHVIGQTMAGRSRAPVLRGATVLLLSRPDGWRLAAKGRVGRVPAAGRFWRGAAGHAGFSRGDLAADFIFFAATSSELARSLWFS